MFHQILKLSFYIFFFLAILFIVGMLIDLN
jgi:hypothetical protein